MEMRNLMPWRKREDDPFTSLQRMMNSVIEDFSRQFDGSGWLASTSGWMPRLDVAEDDKAFLVTAELPGIEADDVQVTLDGDILTIRGEKRSERERKDKSYHLMERSYGAFHRAIRLPAEVDREKVGASFRNGVLTVSLPKSEGARASARTIPVKQI